MSVATKTSVSRERVFNVPNQLTVLRLLLSLALFALIALEYYLASLIVFIVAASTDWLDGYWARKYGQVTTLGRILDPFVDKIIVCGTFIFLAAVPGSGVAAWMAVLIANDRAPRKAEQVNRLRPDLPGHAPQAHELESRDHTVIEG